MPLSNIGSFISDKILGKGVRKKISSDSRNVKLLYFVESLTNDQVTGRDANRDDAHVYSKGVYCKFGVTIILRKKSKEGREERMRRWQSQRGGICTESEE